MLIVPKFNLIFVHIPKTGGKSFSRCVQKHYNKLFPNELKQSLLRYDLINNRPMETHSTASEIRTAVGETFYKKANKICFVRNPYDRLVSLHFYGKAKIKDYKPKTFTEYKEYLKNNPSKICDTNNNIRFFTKPQSFYIDESIDIIKNISTLNDTWDQIKNELDLDLPELTHANKSEHKHWSNYYTPAELKFFKEYFKGDFELFGGVFND